MARSQMKISSMIVVLNYLLKDRKARAILDRYDSLKSLLPHLTKVLALLEKSRGKATERIKPEREQEIRRKLKQLDLQHDGLNRLLYNFLSLVQLDQQAPLEFRESITELQEALFPFGLRVIQLKWTEEAGEAQRLKQQISEPAIANLLGSLVLEHPHQKTSALKTAEDIVDTGSKMETLLLELYNTEERIEQSDYQARLRFLKVMKRFVLLAELELEDQPEQLDTLLQALRTEEARAITPASSNSSTSGAVSTPTSMK